MAERKSKAKVGGNELIVTSPSGLIDESTLFARVAAIIENRKYRAYARVNTENTMMFWEIGEYINSVVLDSKRAD